MTVAEPASVSNDFNGEKVPVVFFTKTSAYVLSERPMFIPVTSKPAELSDLVRHLLENEGEVLEPSISFNFLFETAADNKLLLRDELKSVLLETGWTLERTVRLEYFEASKEPELINSIEHPDWVKTIAVAHDSQTIFSGCFDGCVRGFSTKAEPIFELRSHSLAITGIAVIPPVTASAASSSSPSRLVSVSMDGSGEALHLPRDHPAQGPETTFTLQIPFPEGISCVAASRRGDFLAVGSGEGKISLYSARREVEASDEVFRGEELVAESKAKKSRKAEAVAAPVIKARRSRIFLEAAHSSSVTALLFDSASSSGSFSTLFSASLDGSIRAWDLNEQSFSFILSAGDSAPITALAQNPHNPRLFLSGHPDGSVRLWDITEPLRSSSALQPTTFFANNPLICKKRLNGLHRGWITALAWSPKDENTFASIGHDGALHIWDVRSPVSSPSPQYTLISGCALVDGTDENEEEGNTGSGKLLALHWSATGLLLCGGEDCKLSIFATK